MKYRINSATLLLWFGITFLYTPILILMVYSFNASRLVAVWGGFSNKWYGELLDNAQVLAAAWLSLKVAFASATLATVLGTLAGMALARYGLFKGRALFSALVSAPMIMPEIITGLALLLIFVTLEQLIGWPTQRGELTIIIAHGTFALAFVAVIVQSRLAGFDRSLEEAALDLGARPWKVFLLVTLPLISPAIAGGWLLAFTLSLDDLVLSSFVSGPSANTLPMLIFSKIRLGVTPEINAMATLLILLVFVIVTTALYLQRHRRD